MLELLLELLGLLVCIGYFYHDYQKAKLEGMNLLDYLRSYVRSFKFFQKSFPENMPYSPPVSINPIG